MQIKPELADDYGQYVLVNNDSDYSKRCVTYGEEWAELMEAEIARRELIATGPLGNWSEPEKASYAEGVLKVITECAEQTSHTADTDGITGFMYGAAVAALSRFWIHGDQLRSWHNRQYLSEEKAAEADARGGVVNPAIMTIGE